MTVQARRVGPSPNRSVSVLAVGSRVLGRDDLVRNRDRTLQLTFEQRRCDDDGDNLDDDDEGLSSDPLLGCV